MASRLSDDEIEQISEKVASKLGNKLWDIMKELMPGAISMCEEERRNAEQITSEATSFVRSHPETFKTNLRYRREKYEQYCRAVHIINLYDECMNENPPYIPKKFREDRYHVRNERELEKVYNRSMANFQCEYDILTIRKSDYKEQLDNFTNKTRGFVNEQHLDEPIQKEIMNIWEREAKKDEDSVIREWKKKIIGVKKSFTLDKKNLENINRNRFQRRENTNNTATPEQPTMATNNSSTTTETRNNITTAAQTTTAAPPITTISNSSVSNQISQQTTTTLTPSTSLAGAIPSTTVHQTQTLTPPTSDDREEDSALNEILADDTILEETDSNTEPNGDLTNNMIQQLANEFDSPFRNGDSRQVPPQNSQQPRAQRQRSRSPQATKNRRRSQRPSPSPPRTRYSSYRRNRSPAALGTRRSTRHRQSPSPPHWRARREEEINRRRRIEEGEVQHQTNNHQRRNQRY